MAKAILFDFWGTLVEQGVWSPIKQIRNTLRIYMPFSDYVKRMQNAMMTKDFKELREALHAIGEEFNIDITKREMEELIGTWNKAWMLAKPYEETIEVLEELKKEYKLVLVSNTDPFSIEKVLEKFDLNKYFDEIYLSYKEGMVKNNPEFFPRLFERIGINVEDCVMVGDSLQSDIEAAKNVGMKAVLIDRKGRREFEPKIANLKELKGVL